MNKPREHKSALLQLTRYLVLDALIGNTDRHHENWGFLWRVQVSIDEVSEVSRLTKEYLVAPTFDLASSLGRELPDSRRLRHLQNGTVENYLRKARGAIYVPSSKRGSSPLALVESTAQKYPEFFRPALEMLRKTPLDKIIEPVDHVPVERMSGPAKDFAKAMLTVAYECLRRVNL